MVVSTEIPYYFKSMDWDAFIKDYPPPPLFGETVGQMSADEIHALQEKKFLERMDDAWQVEFYRKRWTEAGLEPGDIRWLDDINKIPTFNSDDLKQAIADAPPFGSHHPIAREDFGQSPLKIQTSGGTTGMPRVTLFDTNAWEVQGIQVARAMYAQGARPGDIVQIPYTNSLANAAWCAYLATHHWLGCVPVTTGSGIVTPTQRQLEYAFTWGTNGWFARGEYLGRMAEVAKAEGLDLRELPTRFIHSYLGPDTEGHMRGMLEEAWGTPVYDNYGSHEVGLIAWECQAKDNKHISEDTAYVEIVDTETEQPLPSGEKGDLVVTSLHRSVPPLIRYNMRDLLVLHDREPCSCGLHTKKLSMFLGRSDEMVKLRGTNVYPLACQNAVTKDSRTTGDYLCVVYYVGENLARREEMVIRIERESTAIDSEELKQSMVEALHRDLGVKVDVEIVDPGTLAEHTKLGGEGKVRRLLDLRK